MLNILILLSYLLILKVIFFNSPLWLGLLVIASIYITFKNFTTLKINILKLIKSDSLFFLLIFSYFLTIIFHVINSDNYDDFKNIFAGITYIFMIILGYIFSKTKSNLFNYNLILKWAKFIFLFDSTYMYLEIIFRNLKINFPFLFFLKRFILNINTSIFKIPIDENFYNSLPVPNGPRFFPHSTAALFFLSAFILIFRKEKESIKFSFYQSLIIINTTLISFLLGVRTYFFITLGIVFYLIIQDVFKSKINLLKIIIYTALFLMTSMFFITNKNFQQMFYHSIFSFTYIDPDTLNEEYQNSAIDLIFNFKYYILMIEKMNLFEIFFGTRDLNLVNINSLPNESPILIYAYKYGFISTLLFLFIPILSIFRIASANNLAKNFRNLIVHSPNLFIPFFADIIHIGRFLSIPYVLLIGYLIGYGCSFNNLKFNLEQKTRDFKFEK